ncbi:MAG: aminodeoxychorismate synthase component I [Candidatus Altiarchaeota archaeon]
MANQTVFVREITDEVVGDAALLFGKLSSKPYSFFLDSGGSPEKLGRYSIIGADPSIILESRGEKIELTEDGIKQSLSADPLSILEVKLAENKLTYHGGLPFVGGAVGYLSYDLAWLTEGVKLHGIDDVKTPDLSFGFYDTVLIADHFTGKKYVASTDDEKADKLVGIISANAPSKKDAPQHAIKLESNFTEKKYHMAVKRVRDYIAAGDTYQVNLSQRFTAKFSGNPWMLYQSLRELNPAPFSAYLNFGEVKVLSSSPERFLKIRDGVVETRPIKGTRPRGKTPREDEALKAELSCSEKDKAEHVMIVDLERNDLGKVCEYGSVYVAEMEVIESYATVHHMVSTVKGRLREGVSLVDCVRATFPGGSITGAPKVRAIEIIDELEPNQRGIYCGSIGYLGYNGVADLNIVIRTMIVKDGKLYFSVGGGVVYDSSPEGEYQETLDKGEALMRSLGL